LLPAGPPPRGPPKVAHSLPDPGTPPDASPGEHDAPNHGDTEAPAILCAADLRLDMSDRVFNPAVYSGHDGIRRFLAEVHEVWETFTWEPTDVKEAGDVVLALVHSLGRGRESGLEIDRHSAMLWQIPDETLLAVTFYRDPSAARRAASIDPA
jgi:ketosteroid isomerase-like protein